MVAQCEPMPFVPLETPFAPYSSPNYNTNANERSSPSSGSSLSNESRHSATPPTHRSTPPTSHRRGKGVLSAHNDSSKVTKKTSHDKNTPIRSPTPHPKAKATAAGLNPATQTQQYHAAGLTRQQAMEPISPIRWTDMSLPQKPPSAAEILSHNCRNRLSWQIRVARFLRFNKIHGPYEIGDFLCEVDRATAKVEKVAIRDGDPFGETYWVSMLTGNVHPEMKDEGRCGTPCWCRDGSFMGYVRHRKLESTPAFLAKSNLREALFGVKEEKSPLRWGNDPMWF